MIMQFLVAGREGPPTGPAMCEEFVNIHSLLEVSSVQLSRILSEQQQIRIRLALAFLAKQIFIETWRLAHRTPSAQRRDPRQHRDKKGRRKK